LISLATLSITHAVDKYNLRQILTDYINVSTKEATQTIRHEKQ